jgi:FlaA1/EpsC-like NDP-sugar epimerase
MADPSLDPITDADNMITLFGLKPFDDIDVVFTGVRPGEKLFEELNTESEFLVLNSQFLIAGAGRRRLVFS